MPRTIEMFACNHCNKRFSDTDGALACEAACDEEKDKKRRLQLLTKYFPLQHRLDTGCEKRCVDCGKILLMWGHDGADSHKLKMLHVENHREIMYGRRCEPCATALTDKILDALDLASQSSSN